MKRRSESGLTLIEIVLALSISVVLLAIVLGALRLGHRSVDKGEEREAISQRMRVLTDRLTWLLRGAYPYTVSKREGKLLYFSGTPESVGFVTSSVDVYSDSPQDSSGLKWVAIFADREGLKMQENVYFANVFEDPPREEFVFDPSVTDVAFEYLDAGDKGDEADWVANWNPEETEYLPAAVRVSLAFEYEGQSIVMPPIVVSMRTGQTLKYRKKAEGTP